MPSPSSPPDPTIKNLRDELRALGYLDAPINRFVIGAAAGRTSARALAVVASIRIGAHAGVLLGPAAAIGVAIRMPGLVTSAADAIVLACYFGVCFAIGAALVALFVVLPAGYLALRGVADATAPRRARPISIAAGFIVSIACLAYLTSWWRAMAITSSETNLLSLGVAVLAVAISLLLGRVVTITVLAFAARIGAAPSMLPDRPLSSWKVTAAVGLVAIAGVTMLLLAATPREIGPSAPPLAVVTTGQRVVVIAIDGIDLTTLDRLRRMTPLPTFDRLLGNSSAILERESDRDPARLWTTIATGTPPERHGVSSLETRHVAGVSGHVAENAGILATLGTATDLLRLTRPSIASGNERRIPTFWEVASRAGLRTAVLQWWATWPVDDASGIVVSDRALLRFEQGGALDAEIAPASLYETLKPAWLSIRDRAHQTVTDAALGSESAEVSTAVGRSAELDARVVDLAVDPALGPLDLLVVYLPGLDIAQHALLSSADVLPPSAMSERVTAIEHYYTFLDSLIAPLTNRDPSALVMLVAEPGRVNQPASGIVAISGPAASTTHEGAAATTSAAATVLYALGVPVASDLAAPPLLSLFSPAFVSAHPLRNVSTYGIRRALLQPATGKALDQEMIDRMRSLGYVK